LLIWTRRSLKPSAPGYDRTPCCVWDDTLACSRQARRLRSVANYRGFTDAAIQSKYSRDPAAIGKAMISGAS
jgi:hypothetical protein